ncbi:MAG: phosphoribosylformylglycinamidine synthase subunit PurS [Balneolaceae bacterium]|jgi:phosphoribosylformylglycinamidine synthase subunit PurS|nr:MAG: phosphoribosylformylglycinamidine synthase subunit PurS [Balneolaceae bacterium]
MYHARIYVTLKKSILDPKGKAAFGALKNIGFTGISDVRIGKMVDLKIDAPNEQEAREVARNACEKLLVNEVMEDYEIELITAEQQV